MEASLLVAPKPSLFGSTRSCIVASAGGRVKDVETRLGGRGSDVQQQAATKLRCHGVLAVAAAAMSSSVLPMPCHAAPTQRAVMVLGDLDPAMARVAIGVAGPALSAFGFLFIVRIVMSWYPKLPVTRFPYVVAYAPTEPFLAVTRRVIPPLGGVDVTPVVWFGLVSFLNEILVGPQGLLVLLSQQQV